MIFVTVGAQMPFDRLVARVDAWAGREGRGAEVIAQLGPTTYRPKHIRSVGFLDSSSYAQAVSTASVVIGHAGMGTIITALEHGKPLLVMPRRGDLRETRNDHQLATARRFAERGMVHVAMDESALDRELGRIDELTSLANLESQSLERLRSELRRFVLEP